jgi:AraC-like DNA-binding protein
VIEAKSRELICLLVQQLQDAQTHRTVATSLSQRDVHRIYEARDILAHNFADPPSIPKLARAVGVNQTKLKAGFKEIIGCTVLHFVQQRRMERASELLLRGGMRIGEIARLVGYEYPANFTFAFRRYYGFLPKQMRPAQSA